MLRVQQPTQCSCSGLIKEKTLYTAWSTFVPNIFFSIINNYGPSTGYRWREGLQLWRIAAITINKQQWAVWRLGMGLTNLQHKKASFLQNVQKSITPRWMISINDLSNRIQISDLKYRMYGVCVGQAP
jgi:hypothetical protein